MKKPPVSCRQCSPSSRRARSRPPARPAAQVTRAAPAARALLAHALTLRRRARADRPGPTRWLGALRPLARSAPLALHRRARSARPGTPPPPPPATLVCAHPPRGLSDDAALVCYLRSPALPRSPMLTRPPPRRCRRAFYCCPVSCEATKREQRFREPRSLASSPLVLLAEES